MRLGYRNAWLWIEAANRLAPAPLVEKTAGGAGGGHARLTEHPRIKQVVLGQAQLPEPVAEDFNKAFFKLQIDKSGYIVIVTRNHEYDELVLEWALGTQAKYIGMIGSKTKNKVIFSHLLAKGIPQEQLSRVHAPIGLEIYAQTPEEIAVSILAEVIKVRRSSTH